MNALCYSINGRARTAPCDPNASVRESVRELIEILLAKEPALQKRPAQFEIFGRVIEVIDGDTSVSMIEKLDKALLMPPSSKRA